MRQYFGYELDVNESEAKIIGEEKFVSFGQMADGTTCYHKVMNGEEDESAWYSCFKKFGKRFFVLEGIN